jgi:hypothetical protein
MNEFKILKGWSSKFMVDGENVGGVSELHNDARLLWHLDVIGEVEGQTVLELGALEGAHTLTLEQAGASVTAIEGNPNNFLKCLIVKNHFDLQARFIYADFCEYVKKCRKFDIVSAAGVLYHQTNPADLIFDLAKITDTVLVWAQVASDKSPAGNPMVIHSNGREYRGKINDYGNAKETHEGYCGGLNEKAFWFYPEDLINCFADAGFTDIVERDSPDNISGANLLFVARK